MTRLIGKLSIEIDTPFGSLYARVPLAGTSIALSLYDSSGSMINIYLDPDDAETLAQWINNALTKLPGQG